MRGGHSYKVQEELIIALSGSFDVVVLSESNEKTYYTLNRSYFGLYLPPMTWRHMENFSTNSLSLHLSSHYFDPKDYIRNFTETTLKCDSKHTTVYDCAIVHLPIVHSEAGNITSVNNQKEIAFTVKRVYYLYDVPGGETRGGHGHFELHQLILAGSGSFDITVDDGRIRRSFRLNRPDYGLYLPPGLWRELENFSSGSICLVLASEVYDSTDYLRDYEEFKIFKEL